MKFFDFRIQDFIKFGLRDELLKGIYECGFGFTSSIQEKFLSIMLKKPLQTNHDFICQSQSGTGTTTLLCIAALQTVDLSDTSCQILILAPTVELARQIFQV